MNLAKAVDLFLGEYKPSTRRAFAQTLVKMRDHLGPARDISKVSPAMLVDFFQSEIFDTELSPATKQKHVKSCKTFFNWCVRFELLAKSPAHAIKGRRLPLAIDRSKAMSDAELAALLDVVRHKPRDYALVMFLADTGARRGGAAGLLLADIDWLRNTARVTEKGEHTRQVAFGEDCARALRDWLKYRGRLYRQTGTYVFSRDGAPCSAENVSTIIRRAAKRAGIRVLSSHSLRHRKGHQLADARIAPSIAATAMGHSDPIITLTYYYPADWESAEKALRELMTDPRKLPETAPNIITARFG